MGELIKITPLTLKRLLNYHRVLDNERQRAEKAQWIDMTLERMQEYQAARWRADHVGATVAYADFLMRVEKGEAPYRSVYGEPFLANALVKLLGELRIPVRMVDLPAQEPAIFNAT